MITQQMLDAQRRFNEVQIFQFEANRFMLEQGVPDEPATEE